MTRAFSAGFGVVTYGRFFKRRREKRRP